jgi:NitT/TauT family transport system permease protein
MTHPLDLRVKMRGKERVVWEIVGIIFLMAVWQLIASYFKSEAIWPSLWQVGKALIEIFTQDSWLPNIIYSLKINGLGYLVAILVALPLGFIIGLFPHPRSMLARPFDSSRYIPLTAMVGLFIAWCGISFKFKTMFLAFGILIYLLPMIVIRIDEVEDVLDQTALTLGASWWQRIWTVFVPSVMSKTFLDVLVMLAVSWTYIIVAETTNVEGGIGAMIFRAQRQGRIDKLFGLLFIIIVLGIIIDKVWRWGDSKVFKFKYAARNKNAS